MKTIRTLPKGGRFNPKPLGSEDVEPQSTSAGEPEKKKAVETREAQFAPKTAPAKTLPVKARPKRGKTKGNIERAALHLFAEHGVDGVSTKQIAAAAGISEGAIYRHFSGKEELARSLMLDIHNQLTALIVTADQIQNNLDDKIRHIVTEYCRIADEDWDLFQYHILHLHHFPKLTGDPMDSPIGAAAMLLQKSMDAEEIEPVDPAILAAMSLGVVMQAAQAKVFGYMTGPMAARSDLFTKRVLAVLQA